MSNQFEKLSENSSNNTNQDHLKNNPQKTIKIFEENNACNNSYNSDQTNTVHLLNKLFGETKPILTGNNVNKLRHFSSSISIDESSASQASTSRQSSNQRLEEFKRVVDASYNQHVMNKKLENLTIESSRNLSPPFLKQQTSLEQETNERNFEITNNYETRPNSVSSLIESSKPIIQPNESKENVKIETSKKSPYEIPYMSAYNFYKCKNGSEINSSPVTSPCNLNETLTDCESVSGKRETTLPNSSLPNPPMSDSIFIEKYFNSLQGDSIHEMKKLQSNLNDMKLTLVDKTCSIPHDNQNSNHYSTNGNSLKKHLSSTGSSVNASPTSQSSLESSCITRKKQINEFFLNTKNLTNHQTNMVC